MIDEQSAPAGTLVVLAQALANIGSSGLGGWTFGKIYVIERWNPRPTSHSVVVVKNDHGVEVECARRDFDVAPNPVAALPLNITWLPASAVPATNAAMFIPMPWDDAVEETTPEMRPKPRSRPQCAECELELCAELDAYWGEDEYLAKYCVKCRKKHLPKSEPVELDM
jgi:hypothetical protein